MPNQSRNSARLRVNRWRRSSATDARLAELLATLHDRGEGLWKSYFQRLRALLGPDDYDRLIDAWAAEQDAPDDIAAILDADAEARALRSESNHLGWALFAAQRGAILSEHFWYMHLGRTRPPKEWGL